jgi:hypothetical protein
MIECFSLFYVGFDSFKSVLNGACARKGETIKIE